MTNFAVSIKAEISRLARREVRKEIADLCKTVVSQRAQLSKLRQEVAVLRRDSNKSKRSAPLPSSSRDDSVSESKLRFRPAGFAALRKKLGLSAASAGRLLHVSGQSIYAWEAGRSRPRAKQLQAISQLRGMGKRQVRQLLEAS